MSRGVNTHLSSMSLTMIEPLFSEPLGAELARETASAMTSLHLSLKESKETKVLKELFYFSGEFAQFPTIGSR